MSSFEAGALLPTIHLVTIGAQERFMRSETFMMWAYGQSSGLDQMDPGSNLDSAQDQLGDRPGHDVTSLRSNILTPVSRVLLPSLCQGYCEASMK